VSWLPSSLTISQADLSDNNEFFLHDDEFLCKNQMPVDMASPADGPTTIGLMGRMINVSANSTQEGAVAEFRPR